LRPELDRLNSRKIVTALLTVLMTGLALGFVYEDDATAAKRKSPLKGLWAVVSLVPWRCTPAVAMAFTTRHSICN
jgi:hypothetical protein